MATMVSITSGKRPYQSDIGARAPLRHIAAKKSAATERRQTPKKFQGAAMDLQEQRMQCLKMAFELGGKPEPILSAAQQLMDFITGKPQPEMLVAADPPAETVQVVMPEQEAAPEAAPEAVIADPIAACGTALVMPAGGELADAIPTADGSLPAAHTEEESPAVVIEAADTSAQASDPAQEAAPIPAAAVELEVVAEEPAAHVEEVTAAATETTVQAVELAAAPVDSDQSTTN